MKHDKQPKQCDRVSHTFIREPYDRLTRLAVQANQEYLNPRLKLTLERLTVLIILATTSLTKLRGAVLLAYCDELGKCGKHEGYDYWFVRQVPFYLKVMALVAGRKRKLRIDSMFKKSKDLRRTFFGRNYFIRRFDPDEALKNFREDPMLFHNGIAGSILQHATDYYSNYHDIFFECADLVENKAMLKELGDEFYERGATQRFYSKRFYVELAYRCYFRGGHQEETIKAFKWLDEKEGATTTPEDAPNISYD